MKPEYIICHYAEIGLKGKNRKFFEEKLIENIKRVLRPGFFSGIQRISGRVIVKLAPEGANQEQEKEISQALKKVFGLAFFASAVNTNQNIKSIREKALELLKDKKFTPLDRRSRHLTGFKSFKVSTQRSKKEFHLSSQQVNEKVGEHVLKNSSLITHHSSLRVSLKKPEVTCFIEIVEKFAFLYLEKIKGPGGLPVGASGKAVVLLSGGIDSPVAAFLTMKRGVKIIFVHFHALPYTSKASIEKVKKILKILDKYQGASKLYLVPFAKTQKEILLKTPAKLRVVLYRRFMLRIAEQLAKKEKAQVLVTGESIGQVASQTLENIKVIEEAIELPVLRPLIGQDKEEIIALAKKIGTYDISILPHGDCCSRFLPKHPETKAKISEVRKAEKNLNTERLVEVAIKETKIDKI